MTAPRVRFRASSPGLAPNALWGVFDELAKCWAVEPKLSRYNAEKRTAAMNGAARGRGR